ncbi:OmpA family protein [Candidatus Thiothrix anitrata]|uniref:OmpA family protein n=1 Tax=Candidatus Thiothrix anitrata TaxID=2823902 RepID=A0ABX7WZC6_9GAMM|nr:OmpA family protein [Candidatus Thiothrix anitrata]QTR48771.1 OmpA family protein [Candidatus Thiothrix anitrata]
MKLKSLIVLLLAGIWGVGSWWWYTCKVKGFCEAGQHATQVAAGTAAGTAGAIATSEKSDADKAAADAQAKADADKAAADAQTKADADKAAADAQTKADADKAAADAQAKADADKAAADAQAKADEEKAAADAQAKADEEKAAADAQAKADEEKAAADAQAKADEEKAAADAQAKADAAAGKITMETNEAAPDTGTGIDPALMYFPSGSANPQLADSAKAYFEKVATFLKDNASGKVTIVGHTDNKGKADKNKALGQKRAEMIKKMLTDMGAPADRIQASSEGPDKPVADNNTEEGRQKNRRVEVTPAK